MPLPQRKRRSDAWEVQSGLVEAQLRQAFGWARAHGYARALEMIKTEFNIEPPHLSTFADWYAHQAHIESEERVHRAIVDASAIGDLARETGDVSSAMVAALEAEASAAILGGDPERIKLLVELALKARTTRNSDRDTEIKLRRLELLEKQSAMAREKLAGITSKGGLTPETLAEIEEAAKLL